jgi:hypothetical protein
LFVEFREVAVFWTVLTTPVHGRFACWTGRRGYRARTSVEFVKWPSVSNQALVGFGVESRKLKDNFAFVKVRNKQTVFMLRLLQPRS